MEHNKEKAAIIKQLIELIEGSNAHKNFDAAIAGLPAEQRSVVPDKLPYSIWQLVYHICITQWDILEFSKDARHKSPEWPKEYWPVNAAPENEKQWDHTLQQIKDNRAEFISLLKDGDLYTPFPHGYGQNLLREALLIGDHTAYHTAEIIMIRRLLGSWK